MIRTDNQPITPPATPSDLSASAVAHNQIDLSWTDNALDETAFEVERADGGAGNWSLVAILGNNVTTYSDNSVSELSSYDYRVRAMKGATPSAYSFTANATTPEAPVGAISLDANGYKVKRRQTVDLSWSGAAGTNVDVKRDGALIATTANDGAYTDNIGQKGGGSYDYEVCEAGTATCSDPVTVAF